MKLLQLFVYASTVVASAHDYSFTEFVTEPVETSTGLTVEEESRIIGGADADILNYPYVASVRIDGVTVCAATLVAPQYLLTTAHCVKTDDVAMTASFDTEYSFGSEGESVNIIEGFKHPLYNKRKHLYNVGLLKLAKPTTKKIAALPAADGSDETVGTTATVLGWGQTKKVSNTFKLQKTDLPIISKAECSKFEPYKDRLTKDVFCAGNGKGKGSCRGDSGGPLIANNVLVGFVSWAGGQCGMTPGVYTRVSYVLEYIEDVVNGGDGLRFGRSDTSLRTKKEKSAAASVTKSAESVATTNTIDQTADSPLEFSAKHQSISVNDLTFSFDELADE